MTLSIEDMAAFCKRKGFVYQDSEIYGGMSGFWDYGPLGVELKENIKRSWWKRFVHDREDVVGMDGSIISHPNVWKASGHVDCFADIILVCSNKKCKEKVRADTFIEEIAGINMEGASADEINKTVKDKKLACKKCQSAFEEAKDFNLMFETYVGPVKDKSDVAYLRPETAQLIFADFKLVMENARQKLPFGIAQMGKAFRNEISPRDFLFRSREFEQMEIEFFTHPDRINDCPYFDDIKKLKVNLLTAEAQEKNGKDTEISLDEVGKRLTSKWHSYWLAMAYKWFTDLGIKKDNLRIREHKKSELAHYAGACFDIEYKFPFGWKEIHGSADRTQFDINQHIKVSTKELTVYDEESKQKIVPYVAAEPSQGVDRAFLAFMFDGYSDDKERDNVVLRLHPKLAPYKLSVFPLMNKIDKKAREVFDLVKNEFHCFYDSKGSIGRRYARQDEAGTFLGCTIDFETLEDQCVTLRHRDTTKQIRVKISELKSIIQKLIDGEKFENCGKIVK